MSKIKLFSKVIPIVLIISILFTGCDVPDISKFTETSAEMTRGIRQGIKDTGETLKTASQREDLFLPETTAKFKTYSGNYTKIMEPTVKTLDALDDYLDMLNALAQANRKSEENAKAAVGAVGNLITTASKLFIFPPSAAADAVALPDTVVRISTGLLTVGEQFRTAKSFKDRVNLSARILEGEYIGEGEELTKRCTQESKQEIQNASAALTNAIERINNNPRYSADWKAELIKREQKSSDLRVFRLGCGVIDLLKFTIQDLKAINTEILELTVANLNEHHDVTLKLKKRFETNNVRLRRGVNQSLIYTELIAEIRDDENEYDAKTVVTQQEKDILLEKKRSLHEILEQMFKMDTRLKSAILEEVEKCEADKKCRGMRDFINASKPPNQSRSDFNKNLNRILIQLGKNGFENGNQAIEAALERRQQATVGRYELYRIEEERLKPDYAAVAAEIKEIKNKQTRLNAALDESSETLDVWRQTHAKLRQTLNTKKPFSFARFVSKVKVLMALVEPKAS